MEKSKVNLLIYSIIIILIIILVLILFNGNLTGRTVLENKFVPKDYIAYWSFDNDMTDATGNNNGNCTDTKCPELVMGQVVNAYEFDGSYDFIEVEDSPSLDITDAITISAWIKTKTSNGKIVDKIRYTGTTNKAGYRLQLLSSRVLSFGIANVDWASVEDTKIITDDKWHHAVGVYDGSEVALYVDGSLVDTNTNLPSTIGTNDLKLKIAVASDSATYFKGRIDEVIIYNRALSSNEIKDIYDIQSEGKTIFEEETTPEEQNTQPPLEEQTQDTKDNSNSLFYYPIIILLILIAVIFYFKIKTIISKKKKTKK